MIGGWLDLALGLTLLAAILVPLERSFRARAQGHLRPEVGLDLFFAALQYLVMAGLLARFNGWLQAVIGPAGPGWLVRTVHGWPVLAQVVVAVVLGDLVLYWGHRLCHAVPLLWRFHAVHHSARSLDWLAAHREHPLDALWSQLCFNAPAFFLGVDLLQAMPLFVVRGVWAVFIHSNIRMPLGPLGLLLGDPVLHRWHHVREAARCANYANLAPYLDWLFGTHHRPDDESFELGLDGLAGDAPRGPVGLLLGPFFHRRAP
jgi:sterol desaturase/sphingolipid hydroxylase (fatty acid hydroxylase superfamily)